MFNDVRLFQSYVKINRLTMLCFDVGVGFVIFMGPLRGAIFRILFKYFTLLRGVSGSIQQACFSAPFVFLLRYTALLFMKSPERTFSGLVGEEAYPPPYPLTWLSRLKSELIIFRRWFYFVHFLRNFHLLKYGTGFPVCLNFKIPPLKIELYLPYVRHQVKKEFIYLFGGNLLGGLRCREKRKDFINLHKSCYEAIEGHIARFTHCTPNCTLLIGECFHWIKLLK